MGLPERARKVGFAGVGMMGRGLAKHTLAAGHAVTLLVRSDASRERNRPLFEAGAQSVSTARALAQACDVIIICVSGSPEVEAVIFGEQGLLQGLRAGTVVIDCSTSLPESTRRIALAVSQADASFLDAAMTGTPKEAEQAAVNLLIGGDPQVLDSVRELLGAFTKNIYMCGATGAGHSVKLLHQFVVLSNAAVLAEAFSCAQKMGVDMRTLCEVIGSGGANSTAFARLRAYVEDDNDQLFRFSLSNALKDMQYYTRMASDAGALSTIAGNVYNSYGVANNNGLGAQFVPHLIDSLNAMNGTARPPLK